jgi:hypothetical protein
MQPVPWLPIAARFLPYRRGLFARHLHLMRAGMALAGRIVALRDAEVVPVSARLSCLANVAKGLAGSSNDSTFRAAPGVHTTVFSASPNTR